VFNSKDLTQFLSNSLFQNASYPSLELLPVKIIIYVRSLVLFPEVVSITGVTYSIVEELGRALSSDVKSKTYPHICGNLIRVKRIGSNERILW
jgi:hypothetical protein